MTNRLILVNNSLVNPWNRVMMLTGPFLMFVFIDYIGLITGFQSEILTSVFFFLAVIIPAATPLEAISESIIGWLLFQYVFRPKFVAGLFGFHWWHHESACAGVFTLIFMDLFVLAILASQRASGRQKNNRLVLLNNSLSDPWNRVMMFTGPFLMFVLIDYIGLITGFQSEILIGVFFFLAVMIPATTPLEAISESLLGWLLFQYIFRPKFVAGLFGFHWWHHESACAGVFTMIIVDIVVMFILVRQSD